MTTEALLLSPSDLRNELPGSNPARLLKLLYEEGDLSRADLARAVGLTKATVSSLIAEMIEQGLVIETRHRTVDRPGRPAVDLNIDYANWTVIAVDLSADHELRGALVDLKGTVYACESMPTGGALGGAALRMAIELVDRLRERADRRILGIGICAPGIVDANGRVLASHNLDWVGIPLQKEIEQHTGLPTCVANDANAAALAERSLQGRDTDLMLVKIGYGVGAGIIANGKLILGSHFAAGEIGHVAIGEGVGPLCVCGRRGCLEATLSLPRLEARLQSASSDDERVDVLSDAGHRLGIALAPLVGSLGVEAVIVTGLPETYTAPMLSAVKDALRPRITEELLESLDLRTSRLGDDIMFQGAVILVLGAVLGIP